MQLIDGQPVFAATDLVGYLACEHLTALERAALAGLVDRPDRADRELDVIRERGFEHEARYLAELRAGGASVASIERDDDEEHGERIRRQAAETIAAMASGVGVIFQATFFDGQWLGYADFLLRVESPERPSVWGPYHYEVADTKLARHVKAGAVLQICSYVEQLTRIQGVQPEHMKVVLGGSAHETASSASTTTWPTTAPPSSASPRPCWGPIAAPAPAAAYPPDGHLSRACRALRGVPMGGALRDSPARGRPPLAGRRDHGAAAQGARRPGARHGRATGRGTDPVRSPTRRRERRERRARARAGAHPGRGPRPAEADPRICCLPIDAERGLATLPEPDPGDLFLDLEGDPYAFDDGVDYLFGVMDTQDEFRAFWSFDPDGSGDVSLAGEKRAFEQLMDFLTDRLERYPGMHVYHYASYEPTALKRLMGRHGTREEQVDRLLRGGVLVDLFRAVRQGLRASVESYSIKKIEALYDFTRQEGLRDAGSSIVEFEEWLQLGDGIGPPPRSSPRSRRTTATTC